jgi:hypothetical protein
MKIVRRMRKSTWGLLASLAAVAALGLTTMFTLGGFSAAIQNNSSTFNSATIQLEESNGAVQCYSTGSNGTGGTVTATNTNSGCTINALVGTLDQVPGGTALTTSLTLTNVGNHAATVSSLTTGACTAAAASDDSGYVGGDTTGSPPAYCGKVDISVNNNTLTKCVYPSGASACGALSNTYSLGTIASSTFTTNMSTLAVGASATYTVTVQLDNAVATNADQGLTATVPFTWTISQ